MAMLMDVIFERNQSKQLRTARERDVRLLYKFSSENITWIAKYFIGEIRETRGGALNEVEQMNFFSGMLVSKTVMNVIDKIIAKVDEWIKFTASEYATNRAQT